MKKHHRKPREAVTTKKQHALQNVRGGALAKNDGLTQKKSSKKKSQKTREGQLFSKKETGIRQKT